MNLLHLDLLNFFDLALRVTRGKAIRVDGSTGTCIANGSVLTRLHLGHTRSYKVRQLISCISSVWGTGVDQVLEVVAV